MSLLAAYLAPHPPIIIPEVGKGEERKIADTYNAYHDIGKTIAKLEPDTIVIISPHGPVFTDAITIRTIDPLIGNLGNFGAPQVTLNQPNDLEVIELILKKAYQKNVPAVKFDQSLANRFDLAEDVDHGVIVPLYFVNQHYTDYRLVVVTYGLLAEDSLYEFGTAIKEAIDELHRNTVVIASGDLSHHLLQTDHYTYAPEGEIFDKEFLDHLRRQEYIALMTMSRKIVSRAGECGKKSVEILLGSLDTLEHATHIKSYEGPFGVGYGIVEFIPTGNTTEVLIQQLKDKLQMLQVERVKKEDVFIKLARMAIEHYVKTGQRLSVPDFAMVDALLGKSQGVFVSIKDRGGLRGCMGITAGLENNLANEVISNAIKACSQDPRFPAVEIEELEHLIISVDVLSPSEKIVDPTQLDPKKYGVIVTHSYKRGLLLPNLEGIDTPEEQIKIALNKAGISPKETYELERFTVDRHEVSF